MSCTGRLLLAVVLGCLSSSLLAAAVIEGGEMRVIAGTGEAGFEDGSPGAFNKPIRLAPYGEGAVLVADIFNHAIRVVSIDGEVTTIAGSPERKGFEDGSAEAAWFASPHGVAISREGLIAVAEAENHTIRLLTPVVEPEDPGARSYAVSTLAGVPASGGMKDGPAAEALFQSPHAVAWTPDGDLLVADIGNSRIRRVSSETVRTVAGSGEEGRRDGEGIQRWITLAATGGGSTFTITSTSLPEVACEQVSAQTYASFTRLTANGTTVTSPANAATACNAATNTLVWTSQYWFACHSKPVRHNEGLPSLN